MNRRVEEAKAVIDLTAESMKQDIGAWPLVLYEKCADQIDMWVEREKDRIDAQENIGTKAVITFIPSRLATFTGTVGQVVEIIGGDCLPDEKWFPHLEYREINIPYPDQNIWKWFSYPIAWMRPIDQDMTDDDRDIAEEYKGWSREMIRAVKILSKMPKWNEVTR